METEEKFTVKDENDEDEPTLMEPPTLKYLRLSNDVSKILSQDPASCLAVHPKFLCIGTLWGSIHLVDHQGNIVRYSRPIQRHSVAVNRLDIDIRGDYVASCSDDGMVHVFGLYKNDNDHTVQMGRLVRTVALDPMYGKSGSAKRFVTGDERLMFHERGFLSMWKQTILCEAEGSVGSLAWMGQFLAWSSELGVRVYDLHNKCSLGFMKWPHNPECPPKEFKCHLKWCLETTLLIAWVDTVRICLIKKRNQSEVSAGLPEYMVEPQCTFTTDLFLSGIAPLIVKESSDFGGLQLILLGCCKQPETEKQRPTLQVVKPTVNDYIEVAHPVELTLKEYVGCHVNQFHLEYVAGENRYFIVSPRDIVVAAVCDANDRVEWYVKHQMFEEALKAVDPSNATLRQTVGNLYIDYLLKTSQFDLAGEMCSQILGTDNKKWEEKVYKLAAMQQLKAISPYLPIGDHCLDKQIYEMVLYDFLKSDVEGFLKLIKKWPPTLYHVPVIVNAVVEHAITTRADDPILLECLAILYTHEGKYDNALAMYLKLKHRDIFAMIHKHKLYASVLNVVQELMQLDPEQAVTLFLEKTKVPVETIVAKLQKNSYLLYQYLNALDAKETKLARPYHGQLVQLYADFALPKLLQFLRKSDYYPIQQALDICQSRNLHLETVYLLGRMGRSTEALQIMIEGLKDIQQAIEFCKEQDDLELWEDLIRRSLNKPDFITYLLNNIGTNINPAMLIERISPKLVIPGLKASLIKMMKDYGLQVAVQESCKRILVSDNFNLQARLVTTQMRGCRVDDEQICDACREPIIQLAGPNTSIIVFFCRHTFHRDCLLNTSRCIICQP